MKTIIYIIILVCITSGAYTLGQRNPIDEDYNTINSIATRYMEYFGNPTNEIEQSIMDYIIYGEQ